MAVAASSPLTFCKSAEDAVLTSTVVLLFFLPDGFGEGVLVGLGSILGEADGLSLGIEVESDDGEEAPPGIEVESDDGEEPLPGMEEPPPGIEVGSADGEEPLPGMEEPPPGIEVGSADGEEPPPGIEVGSADGDGLSVGSCAEDGKVPEIGVPARAGMANIKPKNPEQVKKVFGEIIFR